MTDINNIMTTPIARPQTPSQTAVNGQKAPTLSDFIGMILSPQGQPVDAATLQNMPQEVQQIAEKIAAIMQNTPADSAAPAQTPQGAQPATPISFEQLQTAGILPALTSDLSAALAATLQNENMIPNVGTEASMTGDVDMNALGAMLNGIEPGADADMPMPAQTDASVTADASADVAMDADTALMLQLMQAVKTPATATNAAPAIPAAPQAVKAAPVNNTAPQVPADMTGTIADDMYAAPQDKSAAAQTPAAPAAHDKTQYQPQAQNNAAAAVSSQTSAPKTETALNTLLTAMAAQGDAGADALGTQLGGGFGQNGFGGGFTGGDSSAAANGLYMTQAGQSQFAQYMQTGNSQTLPAQTSEMIALQIQRNASAKIDTFTLQLDPADLGRMDIELKFGNDGSLKAHLTVERPETLAMLQKDSVQLERLLQQSGLNTDGQSLSFDLRQQSGGERGTQTGAHERNNGLRMGMNNADAVTNDNNNETITRGYIGPRGVNIMV